MSLEFAAVVYASTCGGAFACHCGDYLINSRTLNASDNLTGCSAQIGLIIAQSNIVLDCNGHSITGTGSSFNGILVQTNNVTIKNCIINGTGYGIYLSSVSDTKITNNTANSNVYTGIYLYYSSDNTLTSNTANSNQYGIQLESSSNNTLISNTANNNSLYGIDLYDNSSNNNLTNNTANNNAYGIYVDNSNNNTLTNNTANSNLNDDFMMSLSSIDNKFYNNMVGSAYPTKFSFTDYFIYDDYILIKGVESPNAQPLGKLNISKYLNIYAGTLSWIYLNLSCSDSNVSGINESSLKIYRYSGGWLPVTGSIVNPSTKIISANLTSFSDFGGFGDPPSGGGGAVPEFSDYAMILIIVTAICGFFVVKRRKGI